jgi:hypothetical protein
LWLPTAGIAFATPFVVWFATGDVSTNDFYEFGSYDVGPSSVYVVGGVAAVVALMPLAASGLLCDDYLDSNYSLTYRFCFRKGVLVSKPATRQSDTSLSGLPAGGRIVVAVSDAFTKF